MDGDKTHRDSTPAEGSAPETRAELLPRARATPRVPDNLFFRLLVPAGFLFCAAVLMSVMASLGHPESAVNIAIARYSPLVIGVLAGAILVLGIVAMTIDRRRTLQLRPNADTKNKGAAAETTAAPDGSSD